MFVPLAGWMVLLARWAASKDDVCGLKDGLQGEPAEAQRLWGAKVCRVRYERADRVWFAALARLIPRMRWTEVFAVAPATLLAWHRKLAASKYDTSNRRKPGLPPTVPSIARLDHRVLLRKRRSRVRIVFPGPHRMQDSPLSR